MKRFSMMFTFDNVYSNNTLKTFQQNCFLRMKKKISKEIYGIPEICLERGRSGKKRSCFYFTFLFLFSYHIIGLKCFEASFKWCNKMVN